MKRKKNEIKNYQNWDGLNISTLILGIVFILLGIASLVCAGLSFIIVDDEPVIACVFLSIIGVISLVGGIILTWIVIKFVKE